MSVFIFVIVISNTIIIIAILSIVKYKLILYSQGLLNNRYLILISIFLINDVFIKV